jgi:glycine oxidase
MNTRSTDVVIVGGGIVGLSTAYYLGKAGIDNILIERDPIGSHASGFAFGALTEFEGLIPGPTYDLAREGIQLHKEIAADLPTNGTHIVYRERPALALEFSALHAQDSKNYLSSVQFESPHSPRWLDRQEIKSIDSRISDNAMGGIYIDETLDVDPHLLLLALLDSAEAMKTVVIRNTVTGLHFKGGRVAGVRTNDDIIAGANIVLAMGPWAADASPWIETPIPVRPLKGQILRFRAPGPPLRCTIGWDGNYATTKPDGLLWAGTTEEDVGFNIELTTDARHTIIDNLGKMLPMLGDLELVHQTSCLRPMSTDMIPNLGPVAELEGVYLATGGGRKGIVLGPPMGKGITDLITKGKSDLPIEKFNPDRFRDDSQTQYRF